MSALDEAAGAKGPLAAPLAAGVNTLSQDQVISFTRYVRVVLPIDKFVFWVKADQLSPSAIFNASRLNQVPFNTKATVAEKATVVTIQGSLHYATDRSQNEDETFDRNRVVFTAEYPVQIFNELSPGEIYVGEFQGQKFSWSSRGSFYKQADLYHYVGDAVYPALQSQLIENPAQLSTAQIVSNSLPIWLAMNNFVKQPWNDFPGPFFPLFPSYLVDLNLVPPYASVDISDPESLAAAPRYDSMLTTTELVTERVRITTYGLNNDQSITFRDFVLQQSGENFGISNSPVVRDEKRGQVELSVIAMKKTLEFQINYYQSTARDVARKLINEVFVNYQIQP